MSDEGIVYNGIQLGKNAGKRNNEWKELRKFLITRLCFTGWSINIIHIHLMFQKFHKFTVFKKRVMTFFYFVIIPKFREAEDGFFLYFQISIKFAPCLNSSTKFILRNLRISLSWRSNTSIYIINIWQGLLFRKVGIKTKQVSLSNLQSWFCCVDNPMKTSSLCYVWKCQHRSVV